MSQIYPDYAYNNPIQRGEIFLSTYIGEGYLEKLRPVVVIQNDIGNKHSRSIIVTAVTSKPKKELPVNVVIDPTKYSLEVENCTIMANQIFTIDKDYLRFKKGCLDAEDLKRLDEALIASLDLKNQEGKGMNELVVVEHKGQRVLTTAQLAEKYGTEPRRISENYNRNCVHYSNGIHYFLLVGEALKEYKGKYANCGFAENLNQIYLWTEKGCLLHAKSLGTNKAWEVYEMLVDTYFRAKEQLPQTPIEALLLAVQNMAAQEKRINQLEDTQKTIKETIVYRPDNWRNEINKMFDRVARANDNRYRDMRAESYRILEERAGCDLEKRLDNLKDRKREAGSTMTEVNRTNKIDVIEADPKLREIYTAIIKELVIKYVA
jgi:mRNA-degrading endonuclease toxin of MazEF toxin-antitoxin module